MNKKKIFNIVGLMIYEQVKNKVWVKQKKILY